MTTNLFIINFNFHKNENGLQLINLKPFMHPKRCPRNTKLIGFCQGPFQRSHGPLRVRKNQFGNHCVKTVTNEWSAWGRACCSNAPSGVVNLTRLTNPRLVVRRRSQNEVPLLQNPGSQEDQAKLLLEKLGEIQRNSHQQQLQYESCLDEVANRLVHTLLVQKVKATPREPDTKMRLSVISQSRGMGLDWSN